MYVWESLEFIIFINLIAVGLFNRIKKKKQKFKRQIILIILGLFFGFLIINSNNNNVNSLNNESDIKVKLSTLHQPIHINNNWSDAKAAGICTGSGIYSDPYIIEDYIIDSGGAGTSIDIENSEVYFIIQNCTLYNSGGGSDPFYHAAIRFYNVSNAKIINTNCSNNQWGGVRLYYDCINNTIINNYVYNSYNGIYLRNGCNNNTILDNICFNNSQEGIELYVNSDDNLISGNFINSTNSVGLHLKDGCDNNTLIGNTANNNKEHGILLFNSDNNTVSGNTANNNNAKGILLLNSHNNTISGNTANKNNIGIRLDNGNSNRILGNNVNNNSGYSGIYITDSNNTIVSRNNASYSGWYGISIRNSCYYNIIIGNNVSNAGKSGMLLQNSYNNSISANILKYNGDHGLYLTNSHNNIIKDMVVNGGGSGSCILIENTDKYFRIENCTVYNSAGGDNDAGIKLNYANNGLLINNNCSFNIGDGIRLENSNNNIIMENIANNNNQYGIKLRYCDYNTISENEANYNGLSGIHLHWSNNNNVSGNVANYNRYGIWLAGNCPAVPCDYNTISKNIIINNNNYGIVLEGSDYNTVWENIFIDNKKEIQGYDNCLNNNWDNGTVGNYWDDYKDRYPSATNNGFIWDTPYEIDGTAPSQDNYPLFLPTVYFLFINFEISDQYLNTTMPLETDLGLKISCYVINSTTLSWVYLCENSTGVFVNRSMNEGINELWSYNLDISSLVEGDQLMFSFYANDSYINIGSLDNSGLNFSIFIGDYYREPIYIDGNNDFTSQNGVRNPWASGTKEDPFIIENWIIDGNAMGCCIDIRNTNKYFIIKNCTLYNATGYWHWGGIRFSYVENGIIQRNELYENQNGIIIDYSTNITIVNNYCHNNTHAIILRYSDNNNLITKNNCTTSTYDGIALRDSNNNTLLNNNCYNNTRSGIFLRKVSNNNEILENICVNNEYGILFDDSSSSGNKVYRNNFTQNNIGSGLEQNCQNNLFYLNYFDNFIEQAIDNGTNNYWDNGIIGNYWSDYEDKYPNAWNDGFFWDTPYAISGSASSYDNHPIDNFLEENPQYFDIKASPTVYSVNGIYEFNCTWIDDDNALSEVYLKFNGTYYLVTENYSGEFSYTFYDLPANENGYPYQWLAKDQYNAWNATPVNYFILQKASAPLLLLFNGTEGDCTKYSHQYVNISLINENEVPGKIFLYINGNLIEQSSSFSIINLSKYSVIGIYNVTGILLDQNYTGSITYWMTIDDIIAPDITFEISPFYLNTITPQYYQTGLQINCTVQDDTSIILVYLCENSTGTFVNHSMSYVNGNYSFDLDISSLNWGNTIMFSFYAKDSAGNIKWDNNDGINYSIQIYDFQDPITILDFDLSFDPNFVNISTLFSLSAEDNIGVGGSGVKTISYKIDSDGWNVYSVPFNLNGFSEGIHIIYYYATDYAGNIETTKQITVYLDKNNLTTLINFTCYEDFSIKYVNNFTQFTINWNDGTGSGLQNIYYKIDSESFSVYSTPFTLLGYSEGLHTITFYSIDNVGNIEPEKEIQIYLDISSLELEISYDLIHDPNYIDEYTEISITSIEDLGSGVKNVQYRIDDGTWNNGTKFSLIGLDLGEHIIYYRVEDNVGNFREKSEIIFLVTDNSDLDEDGLTYSEEKVLETDPFDEDTDDDGMPDGWEVSNSLDPLIDDSGGDLDNDNLSNLDEYTNGTDPNDPDTDDDGLTDGDEVIKYQTNPLSRDTDGDGYSDYDEIFIYRTDPNNALSSPTMNIIIIISVLSAISISGYIGIKKWKSIHRRKVEDEVITRILEDKNKVLDHNALNERLQKVKSKLIFEDVVKKRNVNGQYILNGTLFVKDIGIEKFAALIKEMVKKIYDQNLSKREEVNLIKIDIKDLEQDKGLLEFIKKL